MEWYPFNDINLELNEQNTYPSRQSTKVSGWVLEAWWKFGPIPFNEYTIYHVRYDLDIDPTEETDIAFKIPDGLQYITKMLYKLPVTAVQADEPPLSTAQSRGKANSSGCCYEHQLYEDPCISNPCTNYYLSYDY